MMCMHTYNIFRYGPACLDVPRMCRSLEYNAITLPFIPIPFPVSPQDSLSLTPPFI